MKESITSPYSKLVFRETFRDESSVRKNGGNPTNVTFSNGVGSFNTSKINYNLPLNGTYSVRIKFKPSAFTNNFLFDAQGTNEDGTGFIQLNRTTGIITKSSGTIYINGAKAAGSLLNVSNDLIMTGMSLIQGSGENLTLIGSRYTNNLMYVGDIDLVEIYQGTLTASEVANLYNNTWNTEHSPTNVLLDFDSTQGTIKDRTGKNTLTPTDVSIKKIGQSYSANFNRTTSKIDTGTDMLGTSPKTFIGWIKPYSFGEGATSDSGYIISNGTIEIRQDASLARLRMYCNAGLRSGNSNTLKLNKWTFFAVTLLTDGTTSWYLGNLNTAPSADISGPTATQVAGTTNVIIGNNSGATRTVDGSIPMLKVYEGILSLEDITQIWSSTRGKFI